MKVEKFDSSAERRILTAMITDSIVLGAISSNWDGELFRAKMSNVIAKLCVRHFLKYDKAPGKAIEGLYESWAKENADESLALLVEKFLCSLSSDYEKLSEFGNSEYVIDLAGKFFREIRLEKLVKEVDAELKRSNLEEAESLVTKYSRLELGKSNGLDLFNDEQAVISTFEESISKPLVEYPGALGSFFDCFLAREEFISFTSPQKRGKSFWLIDVAWNAITQSRKVAYFQVGDLTERQVKLRFLSRASRKPFKSPTGKWPYCVDIPIEIDPVGEDKPHFECANVTYREKTFEVPLDGNSAWLACQKVMKTGENCLFKMSCHQNLSISIIGIQNILDSWENSGFSADVVIIDYADNLAPVDRKEDKREWVNTTWKYMSALRQTKHCLLVTATQCNAAGFSKSVLDMTNFSEDNRKLSHVTGMIGINQNPVEKRKGVYRLNWVVLREGEFSPDTLVHVASCLPIANPAMLSTF